MFLRKGFLQLNVLKSHFYLKYTVSSQYLRKYSYQSGKKSKKLIVGKKRSLQS